MKEFFRLKTFVITLIIIILAVIISMAIVLIQYNNDVDVANAQGSGYEVTGWAWSDTYGWISMSCKNEACQEIGFNKSYDSTAGIYSKVVGTDSNGDYILAGMKGFSGDKIQDIVIVKTNTNGDELQKEIKILADNQDISDFVEAEGGDYIFTGGNWNGTEKNGYIFKADNNLQQIPGWEKSVGGSFTDDFLKVIKDSDGNYVLTGYNGHGSPGGALIWFYKVDKDGNTLADVKHERGVGYSIIEKNDNSGYVISARSDEAGGEFALLELDKNGALDKRTIIDASGTGYLWDIIQKPNGDYIAVGRDEGGFDDKAVIVRIDNAGNLQGTKEFSECTGCILLKIINTGPDEYTAVGRYNNHGWAIRFDSNGDTILEKTFSNDTTTIWDVDYIPETSEYLFAGQLGGGLSLIKTDENFNYGTTCFDMCAKGEYGVTISPDNGDFEGYAWSENIGWIDFSNAHFDSASGDVTGTAQIVALGADGTIQLEDDNTGDAINYGVSIDGDGDFHGWAWNGNADGSGIGWISFNGDDADAGGDYLVYTDSTGSSAPFIESINTKFDDECSNVLQVSLEWVASSSILKEKNDIQEYRLVQVKLASDNWDELITGKNIATSDDDWSDQYASGPSITVKKEDGDDIDFNQTYNWRVKVRDINGIESGWSEVGEFTTYERRYPTLRYVSIPASPKLDEEFELAGSAERYDPEEDCTEDTCLFTWELPAGLNLVSGAIDASSTITVEATETFDPESEIKLIVNDRKDGSGYECEYINQVNFSLDLPDWIEENPASEIVPE